MLAISVLMAATATAAVAGDNTTVAGSAASVVGPPEWWNGDCDAGHWDVAAAAKGWQGAGAHRLGASYLGVPVCGPRRVRDGGPDVLWTRAGWGEFEWECTELAFRFMAQIYGVQAYGANGDNVVRNYRPSAGGGLETVANGTPGRAPQPGDVMSFDYAGGLGHVAVVESSAVDQSGSGSVRLITQNDTSDGWRTLTVAAWTVQPFGAFIPYGWLHDPAGRGQGGQAIPDLAAAYVSQGAFTDATKRTPLDLGHVNPGQFAWLAVTVRNVGTATWSGPVDLGTDRPRDRTSPLANGYWLSPNRATRMQETTVAPGATASFEFPVVVPTGAAPGAAWDEYFTPVWEGRSWLTDLGLHFSVGVEQAPYAPFASADAFVARQSTDFLGDPGTMAGRAATAQALAERRSSPGEIIGQYMANQSYAGYGAGVARLYAAYFQRAPDPSGFLYWLGRLRRGAPLADVSNSFAASAEFLSAHGGQTNLAFVQFVYRSVLRRDPDAAGQAFWTSKLDGGMSRGAVMIGFSESVENQAATANQTSIALAYLGMLGRPASASENNVWLWTLGSGKPVTALLQAILGSAEYGARVR